jgi:hypothetical protein
MSETYRFRFRPARLLAPIAALVLSAAPVSADGPDVTVYSVSGFSNYGAVSGVRAYALGTTSCNIGDTPVNWCDNFPGCSGLQPNQHPVIAQSVYRLKNGRFEQIGMSWLKHGFLSTNTPAGTSCVGPGGQQCTAPPRGGNELGIGCTDTYGSSLNGSWTWLGPRSEVNATTGAFPFPATNGPESQVIDQRIQIREIDLDPTLNAGALYWGEGHYVSDNDALAGNAFNNASYRPVTVGAGPSFDLSFTGSTIREKTAIQGWLAADPTVEYVAVDFTSGAPPTERFEVARKVTEPVPGQFHYEYVIRNMNSDRAARRFLIQFDGPVTFSNVGFKDIDHHSGEPYDGTDWTVDVGTPVDTIAWSGGDFAVDPDGNALRWGTMYNFWFDANAGPDQIEIHTLRLFKPGTPDHVDFWGAQLSFGLDVAVVGEGAVTSDPAGIDCPDVACSQAFLAGTPVELTAAAATDWEFTGWSGDCTGSGACTVTMDTVRSVTATFTLIDDMPFIDGFESGDTSAWSATAP